MKWPYKHARRGTCIPGCQKFGVCHCGCGQPTNLATKNRNVDLQVVGDPHIFLLNHFNPSQWRVATCHPDQPHHAQGLCKECYFKKHKRANRRHGAVNDWERARYARFLVLTRGGLGRDEAMQQLERDVPSEFPEMETA